MAASEIPVHLPASPGVAPATGSSSVNVVGTSLLAAVAVMDRLRSAGGCAWDATQTSQSLLRYLVEECFELVQAIEDDDAVAIQEELGDVLLQVLFHSRIAAERPGGFDIDDVAKGLADKLTRRHPHVFAPESGVPLAGDTAVHQQFRWDELKKAEKGRDSALAGVAMAAPATALAGKLGARAAKSSLNVPLPDGDSLAAQIFRLAYEAGANGDDPETAVRALAKAHAERMLAAERTLKAERAPDSESTNRPENATDAAL
ncbi:nucleoside triphosphate pyrophosphohydrolase [Nakamurella antarctica]|uniref:Nucleoside triphosphate pyrophosphohydrolase n=1 Tax=Nakamurella antarctica TaxID=1902245 RepID=A0A3G8ZUG5_9ACTN|nr:MazG family protein [Nakamurella antarctica]AZI57361.1 nucleoside triphosphate pyrophosphohydrolase [Nakamurella antarctica]